MKTSELTGHALDWAVAKIELTGHDDYTNLLMVTVGDDNGWKYNPSTDWAQGGPITEREAIYLNPNNSNDLWYAEHTIEGTKGEYGPTPLIAAMRCYVTSKLGEDVEVPEELK